ncbi:MAG: hypothetical protein ACLFRU_05225 [Paracoccaceae bacterium]
MCSLGLIGAVSTARLGFGQAARCIERLLPYWQITHSRSDLPFVYFDAYRMGRDGRVQAATWSNQRKLLSVSDPLQLSQSEADSFRDLAESRRRGGLFSSFGRSGEVPRQPGESVEYGAQWSDGTRHRVVEGLPDAAAALFRSLESRLRKHQPDPGRHVWTRPAGGIGRQDLDLRGETCDGPVARAVAESVATGRLVIPLAQGGEEFFEGEMAARQEFGARLPGGFAGFGVVTV